MAHISLPEGLPGIRGLFAFRPEMTGPMSELAQILLHDENSLSPADRELIGTYVSFLNDCRYCQTSHGAIASYYLGGDESIVRQVKADFEHAAISDKLKALIAIAAKVQVSGKAVSPDDIARARAEGATDIEIHDTVLIAASFCMYNRYVDGLATWAPTDAEGYKVRAEGVAIGGYMKVRQDIQRGG